MPHVFRKLKENKGVGNLSAIALRATLAVGAARAISSAPSAIFPAGPALPRLDDGLECEPADAELHLHVDPQDRDSRRERHAFGQFAGICATTLG